MATGSSAAVNFNGTLVDPNKGRLMFDEYGNPFFLLFDQESKKRFQNFEAQRDNLLAARKVANTVITSLGPTGMDKIIVTADGEVIVTNDGATILEEMRVEHQIGNLIVELSKAQDNEIGDGTTSIVVLAGALAQAALELLEKKLHPLEIAAGFELAVKLATDCLEKRCSHALEASEINSVMHSVALTSLNSKVVSGQRDHMADMCVTAINSVKDSRNHINFDLIKVESKALGKLEDTQLINGIVLSKDLSHPQMAKEVEDAKIAVLSCAFEPPKPKTKHTMQIFDAESYKKLSDQEQQYFRDFVKMVKDSGANFVVCQWGFDDEANHLLMKNELPAVRWVGGAELELVAIATGASIVPRFEELRESKLGKACKVREATIGTEDDRIVIIEGCQTGNAVTILVRGGSRMIVDEAKRSIHDALCSVRSIVTSPFIVAGGGAPEIACSTYIEEMIPTISSYQRDAVQAFADALLTIPTALAENSGYPGAIVTNEIKAQQIEQGNYDIGVDCMNGTGRDMLKADKVCESLKSKQHQYALACQMIKMILKIDDVILTSVDQ